jgi:hypothetical protein
VVSVPDRDGEVGSDEHHDLAGRQVGLPENRKARPSQIQCAD